MYFDYLLQFFIMIRYLTHLFLLHSNKKGATRYCSGAHCQTEGVRSFYDLLKQRRRWLLGGITNNAEMFTEGKLWRLYPIPMLVAVIMAFAGLPIVLFYIDVAKAILGRQEGSTLEWGTENLMMIEYY